MWKTPQPVEMLFDTQADPWEIHNLAADPAHAGRLAAMRARLRSTMASVRDTSLVPEPMWDELAREKTIHDYVRSEAFDLDATLDLAFAATSADALDAARFIEALGSKDPAIRYWATTGWLIHAKEAAPAIDALTKCLADPQPLIRIVAAETLIAAGKPEQGKATLNSFRPGAMAPECWQWLDNALKRAGIEVKP
jgi:HEAT repeat protein